MRKIVRECLVGRIDVSIGRDILEDQGICESNSLPIYE